MGRLKLQGAGSVMRCGLAAFLLFGALAAGALAQAFRPDLGLARELIDGGQTAAPAIPPGSAELMEHPIVAEQQQPLMTELPGRPFRPNDPPPQRRLWWKFPVYAAVGLPRDLADSFFGAIKFIPIINIVDYAAYEIVPTQVFLRDPRDWHRWDGDENSRSHGFYDGDHWGFFPSAHVWRFKAPNEKKAKANEAFNDAIRAELGLQNRGIEQANHQIAARKLEARAEALRAIQQGDGGAAVRRMLPYMMAYPIDGEGSAALLATGLALYAPNGPEWTAPLLWSRLNNAQPGSLQQTEELMTSALERAGDAPVLTEALIYVRLLLRNAGGAAATARAYRDRNPADARRRRLVLETALTAGGEWEEAYAAINQPEMPAWERQVLQARAAMMQGKAEAARPELAQLQAATPENPYLNYYLACAELLAGESALQSLENFRNAFGRLELAALQAAHPALRQRAGEALAYARGVLAAASAAEGAPGSAPAAPAAPGIFSAR